MESIMKETGHKRNKIITEAITEYVKKRKFQEWPEVIKNFKGIEDFKEEDRFENFRKDLKEPRGLIFGGKE